MCAAIQELRVKPSDGEIITHGRTAYIVHSTEYSTHYTHLYTVVFIHIKNEVVKMRENQFFRFRHRMMEHGPHTHALCGCVH